MSTGKNKVLMGVLAIAIAGSVAHAQDPYNNGYDPRNENGRYEDPAMYDYAKVIDVQPLTTRVRVSTPQRECWDETRYDNGGYQPGPHGPQVAGGTILGAAIGAVIGHNLAHGHHRDEAAVGGAVIGGVLGHQQAMRRYGQTTPPRAYTTQRCETRYRDEWHERIDAYRVTYEYQGRRQVTELPYRPGDRIRVRVDVSPAE